MLTRRYFFSTWATANLLHPLLYNLWFWSLGRPLPFWAGFQAMLLGLLFSLPPLYLCYLLFWRFQRMSERTERIFAYWLAFVIFAILSLSFLFMLISSFSLSDFFWLAQLLIPGCVSAILSLFSTRKQFYRLVQNKTVNAQ
jgi:hypothetical protein